ncbi:chitobiosyldiphosphodolichol beta-mannosyltransferase [Macrosteles quadrilineatus]|uniref:chitobiosyldiphosphodolichol beta-mannosyltransferase n=1 Tax=Macrosteles quadrilineatus TaxID=74068 RepID=UPI0023E1C875|nr:chitobiosyldiphosphodolichol beta-mannosyltransferase [Macrosteles quadrilineatus]
MSLCKVTVVVLGDIGRSPRMQYHASSFLKEGYQIDIVGYKGSRPLEYLRSHKNCSIKYLPEVPQQIKNLPVLLSYFLKIIWQVLTLMSVLLSCGRSNHLLLQTPPAIPALAVCWLYCRLVRANYVIDWHNYAYTIMALTHGKGHKLVKISEKFEGYFGRKSDGNLCVTKAMKNDLMARWSISAVTLYDRPPEHFGSITEDDKEALFSKYSELSAARLGTEGRPALLVSSTSWTEDEDFSILLSALQEYDRCTDLKLPKLLCVITGKGPLKDLYMRRVTSQDWSKVDIVSVWLETDDYPRLLASADLGVSLHSSSSGLDLPMKVVDMLGCGLPVAALHFQCLEELVRHGENGLVFKDSCELAKQLQDWFTGFPSHSSHQKFAKAITEFQSLRWHENWKVQAMPLFAKQ